MPDDSCKELRAEELQPQPTVTIHKDTIQPCRISPDTRISASASAICHSKIFLNLSKLAAFFKLNDR